MFITHNNKFFNIIYNKICNNEKSQQQLIGLGILILFGIFTLTNKKIYKSNKKRYYFILSVIIILIIIGILLYVL